MKRFNLIGIAGLAIALSASSVLAGIGDRQQNQRARIIQGIKSGELTRPEAKKLIRQQRHIQRMKMQAKADGVVTAREHRRIQQAQDRASRDIYRQKHNDWIR